MAAAEAGADAIGLVFYAASPRAVDIAVARDIVAALPPFVSRVALFVNPEARQVAEITDQVAVDCLQFHGDETAEFCEQFGLPYIKALRVQPGSDLVAAAGRYPGTAGILLDAYHPEKWGGTGDTFDWSLIPRQLDKPLILAGGLNPENVAEAVATVHPYAVDVSGGVEQAKGIKDSNKITAFMRGVTSGDRA